MTSLLTIRFSETHLPYLITKSLKRRGTRARLSQIVGRQEINVTESLQRQLLELEQFGLSNDGAITDRPRRMLNITRDTGEFLSVLVRAMNAQRVLEIGTSMATRLSGLPWQQRQSKGTSLPLSYLSSNLPLRQRTSSDQVSLSSLRR